MDMEPADDWSNSIFATTVYFWSTNWSIHLVGAKDRDAFDASVQLIKKGNNIIKIRFSFRYMDLNHGFLNSSIVLKYNNLFV